MGQDTLSWARLGAQMTGLDFSPAAIAAARDLAAQIGLADRARFVDADVYSAVHTLGGQRFDIVYTALVWLPDLTRWANTVPAGRIRSPPACATVACSTWWSSIPSPRFSMTMVVPLPTTTSMPIRRCATAR
jgi:hypothetical protein